MIGVSVMTLLIRMTDQMWPSMAKGKDFGNQKPGFPLSESPLTLWGPVNIDKVTSLSESLSCTRKVGEMVPTAWSCHNNEMRS